jgi:hypothetical protein
MMTQTVFVSVVLTYVFAIISTADALSARQFIEFEAVNEF